MRTVDRKFIKEFVPIIGSARTLKDVVDFYDDDGTNSNVFNNAPRALMCVSVKAQVDLLLRLRDSGFLNNDRPYRKEDRND